MIWSTLNSRREAVSLVILGAGALTSCGKQETAPEAAPQAAPIAANWKSALPAEFATLTMKDGGVCYLDALNGSAIADGPVRVKSGSPTAFAGWGVADVKTGRVGTSVGIVLNSATPYYIAARAYVRAGLGAALKGAHSLDSGGLKLDATPLNVPAGDYRVLFLMQSDHNLLRCDTGHTLQVE
ncbi:MAG TPA: hypothetical protein VGM43_21710 [Bryobacteraceae bacterium]